MQPIAFSKEVLYNIYIRICFQYSMSEMPRYIPQKGLMIYEENLY